MDHVSTHYYKKLENNHGELLKTQISLPDKWNIWAM